MKSKKYLFLICLFLLSSFCIPNIVLAHESARPASVTPTPVADFSCEPSSGPAPLNVYFTNNCTGDIDHCVWDFGDGTAIVTGCEAKNHTYDNPGTYTVSLTVMGPDGSNTITCPIEVSPFGKIDSQDLQVRATPLMIRAPWTQGFFWTPRTYEKHISDSGNWSTSARYAVDFYYANPQSPGVCGRSPEAGRGFFVRAAHSGTLSEIIDIDPCLSTPYTVATIIGKDLNNVNVKTTYIHHQPRPPIGINDTVIVRNPNAGGLNLRKCAGTTDPTCTVINFMPNGTSMRIIDAYVQKDNFVWWNIEGDINSNGVIGNDEKGWAAGKYLSRERSVQGGDPIGLVSDEGCAALPHLMFRVYDGSENKVPLDDTNGVLLDGQVIFPGGSGGACATDDSSPSFHGRIYWFTSMPRGSVDTTPPTVSISSPCSSSCSSSTSTITVSGTATDSGGSGLDYVFVVNNKNGSNGYDYTVSGNTDTFSVSGIFLEEGQNTIVAMSVDNAGNPSSFGIIYVCTTEVCNNGVDDDCDGLVDCQDTDCPPCPENCNNGIDDDRDGKIDCQDTDCPPCPENCNNGIDDDRDGKIDCQDIDCPAMP